MFDGSDGNLYKTCKALEQMSRLFHVKMGLLRSACWFERLKKLYGGERMENEGHELKSP